ncbi:S41 family peptidase [Cesiribacter andamanensis]|uniref:Tail-specific protease n=1 Tax=Cesiribacter andamanensis AMV16 TaxID=1279009 RepID=M7N8B7_9BACT|nr:S41 family peptidase [Cesiribacter andamanensis]EMR03456.1 Tail-specific protease precursor [Cesiribacter andamanensis AMV16]
MQQYLRSIWGVGALLLLLLAQPAVAQKRGDACAKARQLLHTIRTYHVAPPAADSLFGERVLQQFVGILDPYGLYLTRQEVDQLRPHFSSLEAQSTQGKCGFVEESVRLFMRQYRFADSLRQALLRQPFHWQQADTLYLTITTTPPLAASRQELALRWQRQLKYMVLQEAYSDSGGESLRLSNQQALQTRVLERLNCRRSRMLDTPGGLQDYVEESLLEALASSFDPHTNFLPASIKQQFEASLSVEAESFGIELEENRQGDVQIGQLVPGGPAWKSNELHQGDVLLQLRPKRGGTKSFSCTNLEEAARLLNDATHRHVFLTVRKQNGKTKTVELVKEKLQVEENAVQSFILTGERKIGYLSLPGFYTQWDEQGRERGCAQDVARELLKMKREGIEGLILDLRFNGGGSVQEALNLAGIFIDEGPLGIEHSRGEAPRLLRDLNRGTLFDAPLLVLVNGFSASASEILARSLQNYNRALVVGSKTYGKASMQSLIPLDASASSSWGAHTRSDFVKVTISRYYDLKGATYQYHGVLPDVLLEDGLAVLGQHESAYPTALQPDAIQKKVVYQPLPPLPVQDIALRSQRRLQQNTHYHRQLEQARQLEASTRKGFPLRLSPEEFRQDYAWLNNLMGTEEEQEVQPDFDLSPLGTGQPRLIQSPEQKEAEEQLVKDLRQDAWLGECYHIMLDLLGIVK